MKTFLTIFLLLLSMVGNNVVAGTESPKFVFVGDSNTASVQWENGSYVVKLGDYEEPWSQMDLVNSGVDGWGAYSYYESPALINQYILNHQPAFVLIALGGNDFLRFYSAEDFDLFYRYLIGTLVNMSTACSISQIYLANIYWGSLNVTSSGFTNRYYEFQEVISEVANDYQLPLIDFFGTTENHTEFYSNDPIHLNEEGHLAIARTINNTIGQDLLNKLESLDFNPTICELDITNPTSSRSQSSSNSSDTPLLLVPWIITITTIQRLKRKKIELINFQVF